MFQFFLHLATKGTVVREKITSATKQVSCTYKHIKITMTGNLKNKSTFFSCLRTACPIPTVLHLYARGTATKTPFVEGEMLRAPPLYAEENNNGACRGGRELQAEPR